MSRKNPRATSHRLAAFLWSRREAASGRPALQFSLNEIRKDSGIKEDQVQNTIEAGNVLIKEGTPLPEVLRIESEVCVPGWALVEDLDGYGLDREIQKAGWTFFCLAGEVKATVLGINRQKMVRAAIKRIVERPKSKEFNSLEITRVAPRRFLGVPYMSVDAQLRHIQGSSLLRGTKGRLGLNKVKRERPNPSTSASGKTPLSDGPAKQPSVVPILNP
jgi:hypothetical protein